MPGTSTSWEWKPGWLTLATLGIYTRPWMHIDYPDLPPSLGRLEGDAFDPEAWKPEYPNPALDNVRADDAFWAAKIVAELDEADIRAVVGKGQFTDPAAPEALVEILMKRRDKVLRRWLAGINPLVDFALGADGRLTFGNAAVNAGVASPASQYTVEWFGFDNLTGESTPVGEESLGAAVATAPPALLADAGVDFIECRVSAVHPDHPSWAEPVVVHFRRASDGWGTGGPQASSVTALRG